MPAVFDRNPLSSWRWQDGPAAQEVFSACRKMLSREIGVAEAARRIDRALCHDAPMFSDFGHPDFSVFPRVDAATAHLPVGELRRHWSVAALKEKDVELTRIESEFLPEATAEARRLLAYAATEKNG